MKQKAWSDITSVKLTGGPSYVVLRGAAYAARLALYALPLVRLHRLHHVVGELQTRGVTCAGATGTPE